MEAKDLRIGNYIKVRNNFSQVTSIESYEGEYFIYFAGGDDNLTIQGLDPIRLTEEILLKCGFKYTYERLILPDVLCDIEFNYDSELGNIDLEMDISVCTIYNCKFLHQLQNLYFAITGKELEINL